MLNEPASCFVDAVEIALGAPSSVVADDYLKVIGEHDHDPSKEGYHPSIVSQVLANRFGLGLAMIDFVPVGDGEQLYGSGPTDALVGWFRRPGFRCVVAGPRNDTGEQHALAFREGRFLDPATGDWLDEPNIALQYLWCTSVPPLEVAS